VPTRLTPKEVEINMRTIKDLLNTPEGREFLEINGIITDQDVFIAQMESPKNPALQQYLRSGIQKPVYAFQQIYVDVTQSMVDRMQVLDKLERFEGVDPIFLWIDTDRAGSDKITTRIYWPHWGKVQSIPICPHRTKDVETRFVQLDSEKLDEAIQKLGMYLIQSVRRGGPRVAAEQRLGRLESVFTANDWDVLSEFNHRVTCFLLDEYLELNPASVMVSDLIDHGVLTAEVELMVNNIEDIIRLFNQARTELVQQEIDPIVKPLAEDYLPLNYSCPVCQRRLRLRHEIQGSDHFAMATCRCGEAFRFYLGNHRLSIVELAQTRRWSPDVSLALFMNDLVSGFVGGQSSGVYFGLLMKAALEKVLNKRRVPVLLPQSLEKAPPDQFDSLIYRYLTEPRTEISLPEGAL
jgi:hypothetical protein